MTLLTRHETDLKTNAYWVDLMQYTALGDVLAPAKRVSCIADLPDMYDAATVDDMYEVGRCSLPVASIKTRVESAAWYQSTRLKL
jgi:hypothetical protein